MTFSKSASLCDTEGSYICVIPCKLRLHVTKQLEKVCLSWCFSRQLCIVHCVGCSVAAACFLPVHWGGVMLCMHTGGRTALHSFSVCFVEVARTYRGEIAEMLSMPEQRRKDSHQAPATENERPADFFFSSAW